MKIETIARVRKIGRTYYLSIDKNVAEVLKLKHGMKIKVTIEVIGNEK